MLVPAFARTRTNSPTIQCLNNLAQLQRACAMYAAENSGRIAANNAMGVPSPDYPLYTNWCIGLLNWQTSASNTNTQDLIKGALGPYTAGKVALYKCPADRVPAQNGPRVRSYSMNMFVGGYTDYAIRTGYRMFLRDSDLTAPGAAMTFVFADEHPDSLDDATFTVRMPGPLSWPAAANWLNVPGSHHNGAGVLSFADGHVEIHQWLDANTKAPVLRDIPIAWGKMSPNDSRWLVSRASAP